MCASMGRSGAPKPRTGRKGREEAVGSGIDLRKTVVYQLSRMRVEQALLYLESRQRSGLFFSITQMGLLFTADHLKRSGFMFLFYE